MKHLLCTIASLLCFWACTDIVIQEDVTQDGIKVTFTESEGSPINPERGFYTAKDFSSSTAPLKPAEVAARRRAGNTLWYLGFYLTDFMEGDISEAYLNTMQSSFDALREGGAKCILRFAYKPYYKENELMDAKTNVVMRHVEQLKPLFQRNADVIFVLQAGFVGSWGEWYYTSHFVFGPTSDADYQPRKQLTEALLAALPASRQVQLRTPQFKMRMYGLGLKDTITAATAHNGSALSRLAGHNDCFGASANDYGTFDNEDDDREFWKADSRYFIMGGETCGVSNYCTCQVSQRDMTDYHWTFLNQDYNTDVLKRWKSTGCFSDIEAKLGYRLVLQDLYYSKDFAGNKPCTVTLHLINDGYASPMNPRDAILVWMDADGKLTETPLNSDPRTWQPGPVTVTGSFTPNSATGTLYLKLSDPLLRDDPHFSIALANEDVFNSETGLNKLFEVK